jgi:GNAT superfamily N-acetyltransferase
MITIRMLDTRSRRDVKTWIALPYRLYRNDPLWVPQMVGEAKAQLNREVFPFYLHSHADFLVAEQDGEVVGRVALLENRRYNELRQERTAFFNLFETVEDFGVAEALFAAARDWCRERGLTKLVGPKGFLIGDSLGMLVAGFDRPPALGIAYNPPFYGDFMVRLGFERENDFMSGWVSADHPVDERIFRLAERVRQRYGFEFKKLHSKRDLKALVPKVIDTYNASFVDNWEFVPITPEEGDVIAARLMDIIEPELQSVVTKDDEVVGFLMIFPDINNAIRRTGGRLWPLGWFHLLREFRRTQWLDFFAAGVLPQYQGRGVTAMLFAEFVKTVRQTEQYKFAEIVQIAESAQNMQREAAHLGIQFDKRHRIFWRAV